MRLYSKDLFDRSGGVPAAVADLMVEGGAGALDLDEALADAEAAGSGCLFGSESATASVCSLAANAVLGEIGRWVESQEKEVEAARVELGLALARLLGARAYMRALEKVNSVAEAEAGVWACAAEKLEEHEGPGGPGGV